MRIAVGSRAMHTAVREAGHQPVALDRQQAEALLLDGPHAWETLRGHRASGETSGAIIYTSGPPPLDRPLLEPVLLLRKLRDLDAALVDVQRSVRPGHLRLPVGTVDLGQALFHHQDGRTSRLSSQEWRLLGYLGARAGRVVPREELQLQVWDHTRPVPTRAVDMAVSRLRAKIEVDASEPSCLLTLRNVGYRLVVETNEDEVLEGLFGRGEAITDIRSHLEHDIVCVSGPPGIGKSRTAGIAAASFGAPLYVSLEGVRSFDVAVSTLALAARLPVEASPAAAVLDRLLTALPPRMVIVWDDADDVPDLVQHLLRTDRKLQLVTRRTDAPELHTVRLTPLTLEQSVALLEQRTGVRGGLLGVARALDGIPLSIELAAARLHLLGPQGLEDALAEPLAVLTGEARSLRAAISASWARLSPHARQLLAALSWFRQTFTGPDAIELGQAHTEVWLELLEAHLVQRDGERFRLLHSIRAFAAEHGKSHAERYIDWVAQHTARWTAQLDGHGGLEAHQLLSEHVPDLRTTHAWVLEQVRGGSLDAEPLLAQVTLSLDRELRTHASVEDRETLLADTLDALVDPQAKAIVLFERADLRSKLDRHAALEDYAAVQDVLDGDRRARAGLNAAHLAALVEPLTDALARMKRIDTEHAERSTQLRVEHGLLKFSEVSGAVPIGTSLHRMASIADELYALGAIADAVYVGIDVSEWKRAMADPETLPYLERVRVWVQALHAPSKLGQLEISMARILGMEGEFVRALQLLESATARFETIQPMRVFQIQAIRASVLFNACRLDEARVGYLENRDWALRNHVKFNVLDAALMLSSLEVEAGRPDEARRWAEEALTLCRENTNEHLMAHAQLGLAYVCWAQGRYDELAERLETIPWDKISTIGKHTWVSLLVVVEPEAMGRARALMEAAGPRRHQALLDLVNAAEAGEPDRIAALFERDRTRFGLDHRILLRIWTSIAETRRTRA